MIAALLIKAIVGAVGQSVVNKIRRVPTVGEPAGKGLLQSKTAWGSTIALVMFLSQSGWPATPADWGVWASAVVVWGVTLYGRVTARKPIG